MLKNFIAICLLVSVFCTRSAAFDSSSKLDGTWIIDAAATEESLVSSPRPSNVDNLAQWFGLASGYMALVTYEIKGNTILASAYQGNKVLEYQRVSDQGTEIRYILKGGPDSQENMLSVSMLTDKNLKIIHSNSPEMGYLLWKRGQLRTGMTTPDEVMEASRIWLTSVQKIVNSLRAPSSSSVDRGSSTAPANLNR